MTFRELYSTLTPEDLYLLKVVDVSFWSDEVEMMAKLRADIHALCTKKLVRWEKFLPYRYQESATMANVPTAESMKEITRGLSRILDGYAQRFKSGQLGS